MTGSVSVETPLGYIAKGTFRPGQTIAELYRERGLPPHVPVICVRNGKPLLRARKRKGVTYDYRRWEVTRVRTRDEICFVCTVQQGDSGKNILRAVAMIAVLVTAVVVAPTLGGLLAGATGLGIATATSLVQLGIVMGGTFLLSVLLPVTPASADPTTAVAQTASPTYSLGSTGNQARLLQPIPKQYGRLKLVPDFIAQPYINYISNQEYLYQIFNQGLGTYDVDQVLIGDTVVWDKTVAGNYTNTYSGVSIQFNAPGVTETLFHTGVDVSREVAQQEIRNFGIGGPTTLTFASNAITIVAVPSTGNVLTGFRSGDRIQVTGTSSANDGFYTVETVDPGGGQLTVTGPVFPAPGSYPGSVVSLVNAVGPFMACRPGRTIHSFEVNFAFPSGLGFFNTTVPPGHMDNLTVTVQILYRAVDDEGSPIGGASAPYTLAGTKSYTMATRDPQRITESFAISPNQRIEVVINRTTSNTIIDQYQNTMQWIGMNGHFDDDNTFPNISTMAVQIRVGPQIAQAATTQFAIIQTAKVPIWDPVYRTWSVPTATQSIAWAAADVIRNTVYGMGRPDSQIDIDRLNALNDTWTGNGDTFNGVFDTQRDSWSALKDLLAVGRTQPVMVGNIIGFVRDQPVTAAKGVFTPRNIRKGTLEITHILVDDTTPDDVIVEYLNEVTWEQDEVECKLPASTSFNPARVSLFGCTDREQAQREGFFLAASNAFRRILITFSTEMEGKLLIKGDVILVSHDLIRWGQSGEVVDWDGSDQVTLSEDIAWGDGNNISLVLSQTINTQWGPAIVKPHPTMPHIAILQNRAAVEAQYGSLAGLMRTQTLNQYATRYQLGVGTTFAKRCKVVTITPQDMATFKVTSVYDDPRCYESFI